MRRDVTDSILSIVLIQTAARRVRLGGLTTDSPEMDGFRHRDGILPEIDEIHAPSQRQRVPRFANPGMAPRSGIRPNWLLFARQIQRLRLRATEIKSRVPKFYPRRDKT